MDCTICCDSRPCLIRSLPCLHTMCLPCIRDIIANTLIKNLENGTMLPHLCPFCRKPFTYDECIRKTCKDESSDESSDEA